MKMIHEPQPMAALVESLKQIDRPDLSDALAIRLREYKKLCTRFINNPGRTGLENGTGGVWVKCCLPVTGTARIC